MASVAFTVPAPLAPPTAGRKQVTITAPGTLLDPVTLPITSPEVDVAPGITDWTEVARPLRQSLLLAKGVKLSTMKMTVQVVGANPDDAAGCQRVLADLASMSRLLIGPPLVVVWGEVSGASWLTNSGKWRLTDMPFKTKKLEPGTNNILWAELALTFTEASDQPVPTGLASRTSAPAAPTPATGAPAGSAPPASRSYTVKPGDTLWGISLRFYGTGTKWTSIASANGITDPRTVSPGRVLRIP